MFLPNKTSPVSQFLILLIIILTSWVIFSVIGLIPAFFIWGTDIISDSSVLFENVNFLKYYQIINSLGLFIFPPLFFAHLAYNKPFTWLNLSGKSTLLFMALSILIAITAQPFISFLGVFNGHLEFGGHLKEIGEWIYKREQEAQYSTELFLKGTGWIHYSVNIFIIAILPAIGEELLFRGAIQNSLTRVFNNAHLSIWITAILFSAIHLQFFGFLPRFMLGLIFGYLVLYGNSLWLAIAAHFTNNFLAFILYHQSLNGSDKTNILESGEEYPSVIWVILSVISVFMILYYIYKSQKRTDLIKK